MQHDNLPTLSPNPQLSLHTVTIYNLDAHADSQEPLFGIPIAKDTLHRVTLMEDCFSHTLFPCLLDFLSTLETLKELSLVRPCFTKEGAEEKNPGCIEENQIISLLRKNRNIVAFSLFQVPMNGLQSLIEVILKEQLVSSLRIQRIKPGEPSFNSTELAYFLQLSSGVFDFIINNEEINSSPDLSDLTFPDRNTILHYDMYGKRIFLRADIQDFLFDVTLDTLRQSKKTDNTLTLTQKFSLLECTLITKNHGRNQVMPRLCDMEKILSEHHPVYKALKENNPQHFIIAFFKIKGICKTPELLSTTTLTCLSSMQPDSSLLQLPYGILCKIIYASLSDDFLTFRRSISCYASQNQIIMTSSSVGTPTHS